MDIYRLPSWVKTPYDMELYHSGVKNMRWGHRRYQNPDGSLTPLGRAHYGYGPARAVDAGRANTATGITRKAGEYGDSRHREFHTTDSNYSLVSLSDRTPKLKGNVKESYNKSVADEESKVFSLLETRMSNESFANKYNKGKPMGSIDRRQFDQIYKNIHDKDIEGLRDSEVALIGANYLRYGTTTGHTLTKSRARDIGRGNRTNYDAYSPYAAIKGRDDNSTVKERLRDAKDWQDSTVEAYNKVTDNGTRFPKSSYSRGSYISDENLYRSEIYARKKKDRR